MFVLANAEHSVDRLGSWLLGGTRTPPGAPEFALVSFTPLATLAAHGLGLVALLQVDPDASPRLGRLARGLLGMGRRDAVSRLFGIVCALALFVTLLDFRAAPFWLVAATMGVAIVSQAWLVWRVWLTASRPIGPIVRLWMAVSFAFLGWIALVAPWWG